MKSRTLLKLALAAGLLASPVPRWTFAVESTHTPINHVGLSTEARNKFLNDAESSLHRTAKVTADFWPWLRRHLQVRAGLLTAADPLPAVYAENLDHLRIALGPAASEKYAQLLLGVSLTDQLETAGPTGGDGAYNATAFASVPSTPDPQVAKVAAYMKQKGISLDNFVADADSILSSLNLAPLKGKDRGSLIENVAYTTKTYPPRTELPLVACLKKLIIRYQTPAGPFNDKGPQWPLFPIDSAPFPLLAPLRQTLPERELDYLWDRFNGRIPGAKDRLPTYGNYTFDYDKPEIRYKKSDWNPNSLPRIIEDGGVCGRLSTLAQFAAVGLGRPAVGMYQPGHRALVTYHQDLKSGHFSASMDQSITSPDKSTNQWFMPAPHGLRVNEGGKVVAVEWHVALALSMNLGIDRYIDSRICVFLANRPDVSTSARMDLLTSATDLNPYNLEAWYAAAALIGTDTTAANHLLAHLDALLSSPDSGMAKERELAANTDLSVHATAETPDILKQSNLVASMLADAIAESVYKAALTDKSDGAKNAANLHAEIDRRAAMKLPYGAEVQALVDSYSMTGGGAASTQEQVTADVQRLAAGPMKERKKQSDEVEKRVDAVVQGLSSPQDGITWLKSLCAGFPAANRFAVNSEGKTEADPLYEFLHKALLKQLKSTGKQGVLEARQITADFDAAKAAFK